MSIFSPENTMLPMEVCQICHESSVDTVTNCCHAFCRGCAEKSCVRFGMRCAFCRRTVLEIRSPNPRVVHRRCDLQEDEFLGITLVNHAFGVQVHKLEPSDKGCLLFQIGDVITHINNIPAIHHKDAVRLIDSCTETLYPLCFTMLRDYNRRRTQNFVKKNRKFACRFYASLPTNQH